MFQQLFYLIKENHNLHNNLIIVDIQPAYEQYFTFDVYDVLKYAKLFDNVLWLFNGAGIGFNDNIKMWLSTDYNADLNNIDVVEKEYGYFRVLIDFQVDDEIIVNVGKYMLNNNIWDSKLLSDEQLNDLNVDEKVKQLLLDDGIWLDDVLMNHLTQYENCVLVGGGRNECLKEIELFCQILDVNYTTNDDYIY